MKVRTFEPLPELWLSVPQVVVSDTEEQVTGSLNATETSRSLPRAWTPVWYL